MHELLFDREQSVLLVGEGNFSFSIELLKLGLKLKLTSSCFAKQPEYSLTEENVQFLEREGVRVLLDIDATCLNEYEELRGHTFHRIVFNFPHVGGKTKIHLNRELLCKFFKNCAPLLCPEGVVIVSLCRGQGGSNQEATHHQYADTWKVVEMAAHGGFVLSAVQPWNQNSPLGSYCCVGRRNRDSSFQREGAMVHVFRFAPVTFKFHPIDKHLNVLKHQQIQLSEGTVTCSYLESNLLKKDILCDSTSTLYNLLQSLVTYSAKNFQTRTCKISCVTNSDSLRLTTELESLIKMSVQEENRCNTDILLLWGTAFRNMGCDFTLPPASCYVAVLGSKSFSLCQEWLAELGLSSEIFSNVIIKVDSNAYLLYIDELALNLFHLSGWRELWASGAKVIVDDNGALSWQPVSISPPVFTFDLSVASEQSPDVDAIFHVLWQLVGEIVQHVEVVDTYKSPAGWCSKCIRLTYCSYEVSLYRSWVIKLQQEVIAPVLEHHLGVTIR